ncbi:hypothetical protein EYF80_038378 [Liparis tanakae]|uniref:Uncharacterized protein n=1 Tax=Liparis tanakae TaxID=230148 RepID=A0A4Z2GE36_9TELE|nr:hypothetical protein EYF80_038378 [Liparis tanakae]
MTDVPAVSVAPCDAKLRTEGGEVDRQRGGEEDVTPSDSVAGTQHVFGHGASVHGAHSPQLLSSDPSWQSLIPSQETVLLGQVSSFGRDGFSFLSSPSLCLLAEALAFGKLVP